MSPERKPDNILTIEDDKNIQELIKAILEKAKIREEDLLFLSTLKEAKAYLEQTEILPTLILLNLDFKTTNPTEYGLSLLQELRKPNSRFQQTPIVIISAYSDPNTIQACLNLGANAFVKKPFENLEILPNTILNLINTEGENQ